MWTRFPERFGECAALLAALLLAAAAQAQDVGPPLALKPAESLRQVPGESPATLWQRLRRCEDGSDPSHGWLRHFTAPDDALAGPVFEQSCDVDWHKPIFILPYTYSRDYESDRTELLFGVSARLRPLALPLYFAYSQRSFWSVYDGSRSRPFRETVYNPEIFYRWMPAPKRGSGLAWGVDGGYEHESNGRDVRDSRSWDRLYLAPFVERRATALQLKLWYRLPEDGKDDPLDAHGDDNPDIEDYLGYGELHLHRQFSRNRRLHAMARLNPATGHGALLLQHDWRINQGDLFWQAYLFHGYGESLGDYDDSVTRIGIGFALAR